MRKEGDKVTIYQDPYTEMHVEGEAVLKQHIRTERRLEYWKVKFVSDGFVCYRYIRKKD